MESENLPDGLPKWVYRANDDVWSFGIALKDGTRIAFCTVTEVYESRGKIWLDLCTDEVVHLETKNEYLHIEGGERGIQVDLDSVVAFWERADT